MTPRYSPAELASALGLFAPTEEQSAVPPTETVSPGGSAQPHESVLPGAPPPDAALPGDTAAPGGTATPGVAPDRREAVRLAAQADALRALAPHSQRPVEARYTQNHARSGASAPASSNWVSDGAGAPPEPTAAPVPASLEPVATANVSSPSDNREPPPLARHSRTYVVQPGDSLWSIAKRLVGRDASAGLIAREVNRLWTLNRSRIATGDPDLLIVGTRLELR